jgi:hypothetical protein
VFTARYALSPYIKQIRFVFKGLTSNSSSMTVLSYMKRHSVRRESPSKTRHAIPSCWLLKKKPLPFYLFLRKRSAKCECILGTWSLSVFPRNSPEKLKVPNRFLWNLVSEIYKKTTVITALISVRQTPIQRQPLFTAVTIRKIMSKDLRSPEKQRE